MKNLNLSRLFVLSFFVTIFSCGKKDDTPKPPDPPVTHSDTLSAGWSKQSVTKSALADIFFPDNSVGYTISQEGLFKTINGGITWDSVSKTGFAINLAVTASGNVFYVGNSIFKSKDAGQTFEAFNAPFGSDIYFTGNDTGYVVSKNGEFLRTVNGGASWIKLSSISFPTPGRYASLHFIDRANGWIVNEGSIYKINADGVSWTKSSFIGSSASNQSSASVFAPSSLVVYTAFSGNGEVYKSTDGGLNFSLIKKLTGPGYLDLHFLSNELGYACYNNRIYKTTDGGSNWQVAVALGDDELVEIHFTDATHGWACTRQGSVLRYSN